MGFFLFSNLFGQWPLMLPSVAAAPLPTVAQANTTIQQFLKTGTVATQQQPEDTKVAYVNNTPLTTSSSVQQPPSAEPAQMKEQDYILDNSFVINRPITAKTTSQANSGITAKAITAGINPLTVKGSDGRLEVELPRGAVDVAQAKISDGTTPSGNLMFQINQQSGHSFGNRSLLGTYQIQVVDSQGHALKGVHLKYPVTIRYHYKPSELAGLNIAPDSVVLSWPDMIKDATAAKQKTDAYIVPMTNDTKNHVLTAQTTVLGYGPLVASGSDSKALAPIPHLASVGGNSGQLNYTYPLSVAAGPGGFAPKLALNYSSESVNERHNARAPANAVGDGWSIGLGSISAEDYPASSASGAGTWYFLSGIDGVSDRLIPNILGNSGDGFYQTEHFSHLRILFNLNCFHIWDTSGTYYDLGCTNDSLQYTNDSTHHQYRWDLNKVLAPYENTSQVKTMFISYIQDVNNNNVRDAALKQVVYGYATSTSATSLSLTAGTVDFHYHAPNQISDTATNAPEDWAEAYGSRNCASNNQSTTLRCDDPLAYQSVQPATVMSTLTLDRVTSYVGTDTDSHNIAYRYNLTYADSSNSVTCYDPMTQLTQYCAGMHLLQSVVPTIYQNGTAHNHKGLALSYTSPLQNTYYDNSQQFQTDVNWPYLNKYIDNDTGIGQAISYSRAYSNTNGTPYTANAAGDILDDRLDPFYCPHHDTDPLGTTRCAGNVFAHPDQLAWSTQVVTQVQSLGKDSSGSDIPLATTGYFYWLPAQQNGCNPLGLPPNNTIATQEGKCVGYTWIPGYNGTSTTPDGDWVDYYHAEFRGFDAVYITSPAGHLTADYYFSTEGWYTPELDGNNYNAGHLRQEDLYWGNGPSIPGALNLYTLASRNNQILQETVNKYAGSGTWNSCAGNLQGVYPPCVVDMYSSRTTWYEGTGTNNANAPWVQHDYTYDDYTGTNNGNTGSGFAFGQSSYHNLQKEVTTSSNAPSITQTWTYMPGDRVTPDNVTYYDANKVAQTQITDGNGHIWKCQDNTYDEGSQYQGQSGGPYAVAGWPTTQTQYSDCNTSNKNNTALKSYTAYDQYGNSIANVDPFGVANSSIYSTKGCTATTTPVILPSSWTSGKYTSCVAYDTNHYAALPTSTTNALNQSASKTYDYTQGEIPVSVTDANGQTTSTSYSYDSNGNTTVQVKSPGETGSYTSQSNSNSQCTSSSTLPCYEVDANSSLYSGAVTRTFYDNAGQAVETRSPGPDATHDIIAFTVHNPSNNTVFQSQPYLVAHGSGWIDPNGATDSQGHSVAGTITTYDPLGRVIAVRDPIQGSSAEPGISCPNLSGTWTSCTTYGLGSPSGDSQAYSYVATTDANNHMTVTFSDALGRGRYSQAYSVAGDITKNITTKHETQFNVLNQPTAVIATDLAPQSGQTITQVTTTASYDDLGRLTQLNDPDRGTHTYTYDADGRVLTDVSGTRTIGASYDLLGRVGCVQDAAPTTDATGTCSAGSHPLAQNTYDVSTLGTSGTTDFPIGQLTSTVNTTSYPDGSVVTTTNKVQHDLRGRAIQATLQIGVPGSWNVTTALPTYSETQAYNDANQVTTTQTRANGTGGYTFTQAYDSTTGQVKGLSNNATGVANLATLSFEPVHSLTSDLTFQTTTGNVLVDDQFTYDGNLRPSGTTATWQSGSNSTGTLFSSLRSYDPVGTVSSVISNYATISGQSNSGGSETQNFCYDELNRLVWAGNSGSQPAAGNGTCGTGTLASGISGASYSTPYAYTHLGQLWQGSLKGSGHYQYLYCDASHPHQLTGLYPVGTTCSNLTGSVYGSQYDAWGNVTTRTTGGQTSTLTYNVLDELTQWNAGSTSIEQYAYGAGGQRVLRRSTTSSGTTLYVYAFGLEDHAYHANGQGFDDNYYYSLGGRLIGKLEGTNTTFYLTDGLGSVVSSFLQTASSASLLGNQAYGPYGNNRYQKGSLGTKKGFTGQYGDDSTGLDYYNARYYDPVVGVFLEADTVQGNGQGMDPYSYVGANPETRTDPTGKRACADCGSEDGGYAYNSSQMSNPSQSQQITPDRPLPPPPPPSTPPPSTPPLPPPPPPSTPPPPPTAPTPGQIRDPKLNAIGWGQVIAGIGIIIGGILGATQELTNPFLIIAFRMMKVWVFNLFTTVVGLIKAGMSNILASYSDGGDPKMRIFVDIVGLILDGINIVSNLILTVQSVKGALNLINGSKSFFGNLASMAKNEQIVSAGGRGSSLLSNGFKQASINFGNAAFGIGYLIADWHQLQLDEVAAGSY
ncbi:hypothetical protein KTT_18570 [Tengunoibacter tsumagoiensis]|uniref:Intein C-terminal splicing domain-containing protein n=2 Tax=Tengunoibacter tsumagoiensis TaxID=2014871 RepID=A0A401ZYQ7_9CHLR|nr:hypothetical protein KTT_18570 [Tengunoibacter tsumagoiensis]